jgi:hypothetical protein
MIRYPSDDCKACLDRFKTTSEEKEILNSALRVYSTRKSTRSGVHRWEK